MRCLRGCLRDLEVLLLKSMDIKVERLPRSRVKLTITIGAIQMGEYFAQALRRLAVGLTIEGFRPGNAPLHLVEQRLGEDKIASEALEIALPLSYYEAIKQEKLTPLQEPEINIKEFGRDKAMVYEAEVDILPEVKVGHYRDLEIKNQKPKIKITEKDVELTLRQLQRQTANLKTVSRPAKKGDLAEIDFESFIEGRPVLGGQSRNHPLVIGQGQFLPAFEDKLVGMKKGEEREFSITFPENFHNKELAKKVVSFKVILKDLKEIDLPAINDAWAARLGKKSLAALKASIKESLEKEAKRREEEKLEQKMIEQLVAASSVEVPESLVSAEIQRLLEGLVYQARAGGMDFESYLRSLKKTKEELLAELEKPAEQNIKATLVLGAIRNKEGIYCSDKEVDEEIEKLKSQGIELKNEDRARIKNILEIRKTVVKLKEMLGLDKG